MAATTLPAKRKRAQDLYLDDGDDEFDEVLGVQAALADVDDDDSDVDMSYGSHKNPRAVKKRKVAKKAKGAAKPKKNEKPFPFTRLPAELRDHIYELALTDDDGITLISKTKHYRRTVGPGPIVDNDNGGWHYDRRRRRRHAIRLSQSQESQGPPARNGLTPALLAVSKQLHAEGINYLYQQSIILEDTYALHSFLATIGSNRLRVTDLTVKAWGTSRGAHKAMNFCSFTLLAGCTTLKKLFLDCTLGWRRDPKGLARQIYRDGLYFLEAYGAANGGKGAAVDILELSDANYDKTQGWARNQTVLPEKDGFKEQCQGELKRLLGCR
ncbi:hypothetical protein B0A55_11773 [Friedmanniomyces simplex]|uniref:2EXR domain-containing protein n=1 Tax=Friedmanniomyces simplex TaxID=329884 RepID=A0A4U0WH81_9PEZI|nr:hypothetical protein B0A55_11773 [Friedmanniomyces simplex]